MFVVIASPSLITLLPDVDTSFNALRGQSPKKSRSGTQSVRTTALPAGDFIMGRTPEYSALTGWVDPGVQAVTLGSADFPRQESDLIKAAWFTVRGLSLLPETGRSPHAPVESVRSSTRNQLAPRYLAPSRITPRPFLIALQRTGRDSGLTSRSGRQAASTSPLSVITYRLPIARVRARAF